MIFKVPATSANVGCGFDFLGFAVDLFLTVEILGDSQDWEIIHDLPRDIPTDETNLIIATALKVEPSLMPKKIKVTNEIPLSRGLGSSSSAIVAGIGIADYLGNLNLTLDEKLELACRFEGHPDNVAPALLGGFVVSSYFDGKLSYVKMNLDNLGIVAFVPNKKLSTSDMRKVLPNNLPFGQAVLSSAISSTMVAHLFSKNYIQAGKLIEKDLLHEPYRKILLPELETVRELGKKHNAYATYISGAGSTVMTLLPPDDVGDFSHELSKFPDGCVKILKMID